MGDSVSVDDIVDPSYTAPAQQWTPVSSGGGVTVSVPTNAKPNSDSLGLDQLSDDFSAFNSKPKVDKGPPIDASHKVAVDYHNQILAGSQFTDPNVKAHEGNYLGTVNGEDDAGRAIYRDSDGKDQPMDMSKHVLLVDPDDGQPKVYKRSDDTDVSTGIYGRLVGLSRMFGPALSTGGLQVGQSSPVAEAALRQGIDLPRGAVSSPTESSFLSRLPLIGNRLAPAADKATGQIAEKAQDAANIPTGQAVGDELAGQTARSGITNYAAPAVDGQPGVLQGRINQAYDNVKNTFTNPGALHEPSNAMTYLSGLEQKYGKADLGWPKTANDEILGPITKPGGLDFDSMKLVRQRVGEMIKDPSVVPGGVSQSELKQLYGALSDDLGNLVAKAGGPKAVQAFGRANTYNKLANDRRDALQGILNVKNDEGLFGKIFRLAGSNNSADAKLLGQARKSMTPEEWKDVSSAAIGRLGKVAAKTGDTFDVGKFAKDYESLSETGKNMLFGEPGFSDLRQALDDIHLVASKAGPNLNRISGAAHGTGHQFAVGYGIIEAIRTMADVLTGETPEKVALQVGAAAIPALAGKVRAGWLASPITAKYAAKWLQTHAPGIATRNLQAADLATRDLQNAYRQYVATLPKDDEDGNNK